MHCNSLMGTLILFLLFLCISGCGSTRTLKHVAVKLGGSVTIPCLYDQRYKSNRKYWCSGYYWYNCRIVPNVTENTLVTNYPAQNMFTVELNSLNVSNSGWYWCAVEIGNHVQPDDKDYLYLTVSTAPAVSVLGSRVSGEEGSSVSVQCLYSAAYQNKQKQWCRSTDWSCYTVGRTHTSQNSAVQISDDGKTSFNVVMTGLKKSDAGWYWCSVGDVQVPVHIKLSQNPDRVDQSDEGAQINTTVLVFSTVSGLLLLLSVIVLVIWKLKQECITKEDSNGGLRNVLYGPVVFSRTARRDPTQLFPTKHDVIYSDIIASSQ
ncbi:polymeric immunoglobulin receptor-like isoform X2 [Brachyhypopomus gauderio]|uniref:polymeric immunoglobulin receptor-like isoform X2 n=1 Tax=Brachyhypopomus gauderio TaxID=698409 RepID=UPI004042D7C5